MMESEHQKDLDKESKKIETTALKWHFSIRTIFSLVLSTIAVGIIIMLILKFPEHPLSGSEGAHIKNYFYERSRLWTDISPQTGFYIFMPLMMVLIIVTGFILLPKRFNQTTKIFLSCIWILYFAALVVGIIKGSILDRGWDAPVSGYLGFLGLVPFSLNFFIQLALLLDRKSFLEWAGFSRKPYPSNVPTVYLRIRRVNTGFFLFLYLCFLSGMILAIYPASSAGSMIFLTVVFLGPLMLLWLLVGDFFLRRWFTHKQLLQDLETNPELFDNPLFVEQSVTPQWAFLKKRLVLRHLALGTHDLSLIAQRSALSLEKVGETIQEALDAGTIQGTLSEDQQTFILEKYRNEQGV
jgi:hypothetical protein